MSIIVFLHCRLFCCFDGAKIRFFSYSAIFCVLYCLYYEDFVLRYRILFQKVLPLQAQLEVPLLAVVGVYLFVA